MCQNTPSLPFNSSRLQERLVGPVHADELVVLRDDLLVVLVVEDEVLDVIQQPLPGNKPAITPSRLVPFCLIASRSIFSFSSSARSQLKKCSHSAVMLPTLVSMAFESTQNALVRKSCGMSVL